MEPGVEVRIFLDSADPAEMTRYAHLVEGFTTNPLLYRQSPASILSTDRLGRRLSEENWQQEVVACAKGKPISLEVTADDKPGMIRQGLALLDLAPNVYVKVPIQTPDGESTQAVIGRLERVNATCCFTYEHVKRACDAGASIVSVFAGRIADTGTDPEPLMSRARQRCHATGAQLLWASAREVLNVAQARRCGAHIITLPASLLDKYGCWGRDLDEYALETVREFHGRV